MSRCVGGPASQHSSPLQQEPLSQWASGSTGPQDAPSLQRSHFKSSCHAGPGSPGTVTEVGIQGVGVTASSLEVCLSWPPPRDTLLTSTIPWAPAGSLHLTGVAAGASLVVGSPCSMELSLSGDNALITCPVSPAAPRSPQAC